MRTGNQQSLIRSSRIQRKVLNLIKNLIHCMFSLLLLMFLDLVFFSGTKKVIQTSLNFSKKAETKELQVDS